MKMCTMEEAVEDAKAVSFGRDISQGKYSKDPAQVLRCRAHGNMEYGAPVGYKGLHT